MVVKNIGMKIKALRVVKKISQEKLAEKLSVSVQQLLKYETAKNRISVEKLIKAAEILGVDLNYFADEAIPLPNKSIFFKAATAEEENVVRICRNIHSDSLRQIWIKLGAELLTCGTEKKKE